MEEFTNRQITNMKKIFTILIVFTGIFKSFGQNIQIHLDTLQRMSWEREIDFNLAKTENKLHFDYLWKTDCNIIVDTTTRIVTYFYIPESRVTIEFKLVKFRKLQSGFYFEYDVFGSWLNEKFLVTQNESGDFSAIIQYAKFEGETVSEGDWDRFVEITPSPNILPLIFEPR
jgi:hypothetical protein